MFVNSENLKGNSGLAVTPGQVIKTAHSFLGFLLVLCDCCSVRPRDRHCALDCVRRSAATEGLATTHPHAASGPPRGVP